MAGGGHAGGGAAGARQHERGMELLRSEPMRYVQINVKTEFAHETVRALGRHGKLHVVDLCNPSAMSQQHIGLKKKLVRCDELARRLDWFEEQMKGAGVEVPAVHLEMRSAADVLAAAEEYMAPRQEQLKRHLQFRDQLSEEVDRLRERRAVLRVAQDSLRQRVQEFDRREVEMPDAMEMVEGGSGGVGANRFHRFVVGVLPTAQRSLFERMAFRVTRGNALVSFVPLAEDTSVFYAVCVGQTVHDRLARLVRAVGARVYEVPDSSAGFHRERDRCSAELEEREEVLRKTAAEISRLLQEVASQPGQGRSPLREWQWALKKEKAVLATLLRCHFYMTMFTLEGWCPAAEVSRLRSLLRPQVSSGAVAVSVDPDNTLGQRGAPPTHFETTKVTEAFQTLVTTYGVPRYREVNPALFTVATFPFLFGVMFGDVGHGSALLLVALYMLFNERSLRRASVAGRLGEASGMLFSGRYMMLGMGFFAIYAGLIYNDCVSLPLQLFNTQWQFPAVDEGDTEAAASGVQGHPAGEVYPLGVDPSWYHTRNELAFFNSLKMKLSVTIGVAQMLFGLSLSALNHVYFRDWASLLLEFVPQTAFLLSTFGYMIAIIIYKFTVEWPGRQAPNLIQTMIEMFLSPGYVKPVNQLYEGQAAVQGFLVFVALASVPVMLFGTPLMRRRQHARPVAPAGAAAGGGQSYAPLSAVSDDDEDDGDAGLRLAPEDEAGGRGRSDDAAAEEDAHEREPEEPYSFSDDMIHQGIHTIEFVLGSVSHTASYLRLWALSLAHSELSQVFWEKLIMEQGLAGEGSNAVTAVVCAGIWAGVTAMVLLGMDALECFLHALRLQWVEFQSKFYHADGYAFEPFTFRDAILSMGMDPDEVEQ